MALVDDIRFAVRSLRRRPTLTIIATVTLAVGIAANAVMFGVVDQLLLQPPPGITNPENVRRVYFDWGGPAPTWATTYPLVGALKENVQSLDVAAMSGGDEMTLGLGADARALQVMMVSANYFHVLGVRPVLGRFFLDGEDRIPDGVRVVVVSDGFWRRELAQAADAVGRTLSIDGHTYEIVGVAPRGFSGVDRRRVDAWVPVSSMAAAHFGARWHDSPYSYWIRAVARVRPGIDPAIAAGEATRATRAEVATWDLPRAPESPPSVMLGSIIEARGPAGMNAESKVALWLLGVSAIVLLIACANVANLLLARTFERRREIAVRMALGVSRSRLARLLLVEAVLLATAGALLATGLALIASRFVQDILLPGIVWNSTVLDARVFGVTLLAVVACVVLAGLAPVVQGVAFPVVEGLKSASAQTAGGRGRARHVLLAAQASLSVILIVGAGLFVRSLDNVLLHDVGVELDQTLLVTMDMRRMGFSQAQVEGIHRDAAERLSAIPGVSDAVVVAQTIPTMRGSGIAVRPHGVAEDNPELPTPYYAVVPGNYFSTIGTRIARGRTFTEAEELAPSRVMVINQFLADAYWPGLDPIGKCARLGSDSVCATVIGVVPNAMLFRMVGDDRALLYIPPSFPGFGRRPPSGIVVRALGDPNALVPTVRREVQSLAANMPFVQVESFAERVAPQLRPWRLGSTMFMVFGGVALAIAAIGLYSVMAYTVSQRTREIGVRMALGAQAGNVVRLVVRESGMTIVAGLAAGLLIALWAGRWIEPMLYETSPRDPLVFIVASGVLAAAAIVASIVPARRTTRVDPAIALRAE